MKNGYHLLSTLTTFLNNSNPVIEELLKCNKNEFSKNEKNITIALGILSEFNEITANLDEEIFILNKHLYNILTPIIIYSNNLFNDYKLVNSYKLYDALKMDLCELRNFLNKINN